MDEISVIGIDLAKRSFQLCALDEKGEVVWETRLRRVQFIRFMEEKAPRCLVGIEACGGAHYWGRWLTELRFQVKLMAPGAVKAFASSRHKNDARDAHAIAEAATRPYVRALAVKTEAAQGLQALVRVRARHVRQKVQALNQLRALLHEFGFVAPKGERALLKRYGEICGGAAFLALPEGLQAAFGQLHGECCHLMAQAECSKRAVEQAAGEDEACGLIMSVPHLGPVNAAGMVAAVGDPDAFANGRAFAAFLGLVPRQQASGETSHLRAITKQGSRQLRSTLVLAAQSLITWALKAEAKGAPLDQLRRLALRLMKSGKPRNVAVTAIAARLARIAWAVLAAGQPYRANFA